MSGTDPIVVVGMARTPIGNFLGAVSSLPAPALGATAVGGALGRARLAPQDVDEVLMGCVLPAGMGQAPARQAALGADLPVTVPCTTVNKMCGSGMKAVMLGHDAIAAGTAAVVVAGGMESMSNAPYLLARGRTGYRLGHGRLLDHMFVDGLEDAYDKGRLMGVYAEDTAQAYQFSRAAQDAFALSSLERARKATAEGRLKGEIVACKVAKDGASTEIVEDEGPKTVDPDKVPHLKPAFRDDGTVTPANSSSISDGAAALVLMPLSEAERRGLAPLARIVAHASHAEAPPKFTTAPVGAIAKLLEKTGWSTADADLFEINEAFAVVTMVAMRDLDIPHDKVNVHGGACVLGHPIGASGARILVTLLAALAEHGLARGIAALCIGGGEATAIAVERIT